MRKRALGVNRALPISIGLAATAAALLYSGPSSGDDTFIYMRYVQNALVEGRFTFNHGEPSFGVTSPLWTFVMTPVAYVLGNTLVVWKVGGAVLFGCGAALLSRLVSNTGAVLSVACLTGVGLLEPHTLRWVGSGMENGLTFLCLVTALYAYARFANNVRPGWAVATGIVLGILPFARPELAVLSVLLSLTMAIRQDRGRYLAWLACCSTLLALSVITYVCFGAIVPQTAAAKSILLHQNNPWYGTVQTIKIAGSGVFAGLCLFTSSGRHHPTVRDVGFSIVLTVAATMSFLAYQNLLISTRYATHLSAPLVIAGVVAVAHDVGLAGRMRRDHKLLLWGQALTAGLMLAYLFPATRTHEGEDIRVIGQFMKAQSQIAGSPSRVALTEVGAFGFYSDTYVIDLVGLTDRATLAFGRQNGPIRSQDLLERLLVERGATHFISTFGDLIEGRRLDFLPIGVFPVRRTNYSRGTMGTDLWRVYELRQAESGLLSSPVRRPEMH